MEATVPFRPEQSTDLLGESIAPVLSEFEQRRAQREAARAAEMVRDLTHLSIDEQQESLAVVVTFGAGPIVHWQGCCLELSEDGDEEIVAVGIGDGGEFLARYGAPVTHARAEEIARAADQTRCRSLIVACGRAQQDWNRREFGDRCDREAY
jgi:hypothetical protein